MPSHAEFIRNICQHPADMVPRLVYADWLEERGDVRAEFIRLAIELSEAILEPALQNTPEDGVKKHLNLIPQSAWNNWDSLCKKIRRAGKLLAEHRREWTMAGLPEDWRFNPDGSISVPIELAYGGLAFVEPREIIAVAFSAGFAENLMLRFEEYEQHYQTLIDTIPVREVRLTHFNMDAAVNDRRLNNPNNLGRLWVDVLSEIFPGHDQAHPIKYAMSQSTGEHRVEGEGYGMTIGGYPAVDCPTR